MTDESKFVLIEEVLRPESNSWAVDVDDNEAQEQGSSKAWDIGDDAGQGLSMAEIMAEEQKKAEQAAKRKPKAAPAPVPSQTGQSRFEGRPAREPRETQPRGELPTEPPYTAFVGNLPFNVTEDDMKDFFVGVTRVRLMKDQDTGKFKGYSYIVFDTLDSLKAALEKNGTTYGERTLNIDVAKPQQKPTWSSGGGSGFSDRSGGSGFSDRRDREREPNRWGPSSSGSAFGERKTFDKGGDVSKPFGERKAFGFDKPRSTQAPSQSRPKGSSEDPFGAAGSVDKKRQDELAAERLKREMEREREREKEREVRRNQDQKKDDDRKKYDDEKKKDTNQMTWRKDKPANDPASPRGFNNRERDSNRPPRNNDDGFKSGIKNKPYEATGTGSAVRASEAVANAKQVRAPRPEPTKIKDDSTAKKNTYSLLDEEDA